MYEGAKLEAERYAVWGLLLACRATTALDAPWDAAPRAGTGSTARASEAPAAQPPSTLMPDAARDGGMRLDESPNTDAGVMGGAPERTLDAAAPPAMAPLEWLGECIDLECTSHAGGAPVGLCIPRLSCARVAAELECQSATEATCGDGAVAVFPLAPSQAPPPPDPTLGCSFIEFCYAYLSDGSSDEARCIQTGCSAGDATLECQAEVQIVCGNVTPPYVLLTLDGERLVFGS